jgi:hypothetical protein
LALVNLIEDGHTATKDGGIYKQMELVNKLVFDKAGNKRSAAVNNHIFAALAFEPVNFIGKIAGGDIGVRPC